MAGFCVKTRNVITSRKIFLNVCQTDIIPQPVDIDESELIKILETDEPTTFRVPMSLGEGHEELDKCWLSFHHHQLTRVNYILEIY